MLSRMKFQSRTLKIDSPAGGRDLLRRQTRVCGVFVPRDGRLLRVRQSVFTVKMPRRSHERTENNAFKD